MSTETQAQKLVATLERIQEEELNKSAQEITLDGSNKVAFPGYPYLFEALGEKILVSIDVFKSGYECKVCKETGRIKQVCECESSGHPGLKYSSDDINRISDTLGSELAEARRSIVCPSCSGDYLSKRTEIKCTACKGVGKILELPEDSKKLPTTGVVVSMGPTAASLANYKIGDRILFGPYAGSAIPTKAGLMFKCLDWNQAWCKIEGADGLAAFDFIINEDK